MNFLNSQWKIGGLIKVKNDKIEEKQRQFFDEQSINNEIRLQQNNIIKIRQYGICSYFVLSFALHFCIIIKRMSKMSIIICFSYGAISIMQTLNAKFLFKLLSFNYYSFIFLLQRLINIIVIGLLTKSSFNFKYLLYTVPYSIIMCTTNILSSFCITVMPLQSFVSFKKFLILFVITFSLLRKTLKSLPPYKLFSVGLITTGGVMLGMYTNNSTLGYIASFGTNVLQALSLQYCSYMYLVMGVSPSNLLFYNSIISLPYYLTIIAYEGEFGEIFHYLSHPPSHFYYSFVVMILLGCLSELSANYITMVISPFEKATVSNIKDLFILMISVKVFHEMELISMNQIGMLFCLIGSAMFSMPALIDEEKQLGGKYKYSLNISQPEKEKMIIWETIEEKSTLMPEKRTQKQEIQQ